MQCPRINDCSNQLLEVQVIVGLGLMVLVISEKPEYDEDQTRIIDVAVVFPKRPPKETC